jgi:ATP-dependent Clp protease protease subunit
MAPDCLAAHEPVMTDDPEAPAEAPKNLPTRVTDELLAARTVLIFGEITAELAHAVSAQLLLLAERSRAPIRILINSPGGHVEAGDSIHDVIRFIAPEVTMVGSGWVASAGALIYVAAKRERRFALPNTRFLLHQPLGGAGGRATDIEIEAAQILSIRDRLNRIFARETGQDLAKIVRDTDRNHWMTADEAVRYGLVGRIVVTADEVRG